MHFPRGPMMRPGAALRPAGIPRFFRANGLTTTPRYIPRSPTKDHTRDLVVAAQYIPEPVGTPVHLGSGQPRLTSWSAERTGLLPTPRPPMRNKSARESGHSSRAVAVERESRARDHQPPRSRGGGNGNVRERQRERFDGEETLP